MNDGDEQPALGNFSYHLSAYKVLDGKSYFWWSWIEWKIFIENQR